MFRGKLSSNIRFTMPALLYYTISQAKGLKVIVKDKAKAEFKVMNCKWTCEDVTLEQDNSLSLLVPLLTIVLIWSFME